VHTYTTYSVEDLAGIEECREESTCRMEKERMEKEKEGRS
jgi:hypothetical protein